MHPETVITYKILKIMKAILLVRAIAMVASAIVIAFIAFIVTSNIASGVLIYVA